MAKKKIKITESQLKNMVIKALKESANEEEIDEAWYDDSVKNVAKKVGKGIAKGVGYGALAAALGAGGLYSLDKGLENQERYEQSINKQARALSGPTNDEVKQWCIDRNLDPNNEEDFNMAHDALQSQLDKEASTYKMNENIIKRSQLVNLIRESVAKALRNRFQA